MAVLGAVCRSGDAAANERLYVCFVHMCFHLHTHTHNAPMSVSPARCDIDVS